MISTTNYSPFGRRGKTVTTAEGTTQCVYEDKTYCDMSDPAAAAMEVKHFHSR